MVSDPFQETIALILNGLLRELADYVNFLFQSVLSLVSYVSDLFTTVLVWVIPFTRIAVSQQNTPCSVMFQNTLTAFLAADVCDRRQEVKLVVRARLLAARFLLLALNFCEVALCVSLSLGGLCSLSRG